MEPDENAPAQGSEGTEGAGSPPDPEPKKKAEGGKKHSPDDVSARLRRQKDDLDRDWQAKVDALKAEGAERERKLKAALGLEAAEDPEEARKKAESQRDTATEALRKAIFTQEALKAGVDPELADDAYRLAETGKLEVDLASGRVAGAAEEAKRLVEAKPFLKGASSRRAIGIGPGRPSDDGQGGEAIDMSDPKEVRKHKATILARARERLSRRSS